MISKTFFTFILWMVLVLTVVILESSAAADKVRLSEVSALTLHKGKMTTGRRSSPVAQLKCVGGSAKGTFTPKVVQCTNQGHDGQDVQWKCDADMPHDVEFGEIRVSCEGYDYPEDPYVLRGSCGLEYELDYTSGSGYNRGVSRKNSEDKRDTFATVVVICFIAYVIYAMCSNSRSANSDGTGFGPGGGPGGPGSGGGGGGPGGYPSAPPPPYDDTGYGKPPPYGFRGDSTSGGGCGGAGTSGTNNNQGGGSFWTAASLGAIGGYLASNYFNSDYTRPRNRGFFRDPGYSSSDSFFSGPSTSSGMRSSSGFGGTSRR